MEEAVHRVRATPLRTCLNLVEEERVAMTCQRFAPIAISAEVFESKEKVMKPEPGYKQLLEKALRC